MKGFFSSTTNALAAITHTYDFLNTMSIGLWNLRCNIKGVLEEIPHASNQLLINKFAEGSEINGFNPKSQIIEKTWNELKSETAWVLLSLLFATYEGWLADLNKNIFHNLKTKELQFPDKYQDHLNELTSNTSLLLKKCFYQPYSRYRKVSKNHLKNQLLCYRVFKEMRNCHFHHMNTASDALVSALNTYNATITSETDIHSGALPELPTITKGKIINPSLRGVIGFSDVLINMMITIDAELICSSEAENWFNSTLTSSPLFKKRISNDNNIAAKQIYALLSSIDIHRKPLQLRELESHIKDLQAAHII